MPGEAGIRGLVVLVEPCFLDGRLVGSVACTSHLTDIGDPGTRDPERVARDVADGLVSRAAAERDYRIMVAADGAVDGAATKRLRGAA